MNLYFRLIWTVLRSIFKSKIDFSDEIVLKLRILPNDLDINRHLNKGAFVSKAGLVPNNEADEIFGYRRGSCKLPQVVENWIRAENHLIEENGTQ